MIEPESSSPLGPRIVFANETASELSGYELTSLIGSPLGLVYDHQDLAALVRKLPMIARRDDFCWMDRRLHRNGGERVRFRWTIRPTERQEGRVDLFTLTFTALPETEGSDSPAERNGERAVNRNGIPVETHHAPRTGGATERDDYEQSRSMSLALTAGGVAHDFKNALQTIKSNLEMANAVSRSRDQFLTYLNDAQTALFDAEMLAKQMLAFTKGESTKRCLFDVTESLRRVSYLCTAGTQVRCQLHLAKELRPVEGDPNCIYQVLHNLVINACQAMPNGGTLLLSAGTVTFPQPDPRFSVPAGSFTVVSVRDRGCGIPAEALPKIFDKDFSTKPDGNGLGLASCRAIVQAHGGEIRAFSEVGVGTEFFIFLPASDAPLPQPEPEKSPPVKSQPVPARTGDARILVVEDQAGVSKATCGMLGHLGYGSVVAETGEEALALYRRFTDTPDAFDLVLLDMTLPGGLDGEAVLAELKKWDPDVRVIATSGYFDDGPTHELLELGFTGVLAKPYSMDSLAITIDHSLHPPA